MIPTCLSCLAIKTHDGMIKEVGNLRDMEAGDLMTLEGVEKLKREKPWGELQDNWVSVGNDPENVVDTVRSRIVVKRRS